MSGTFYEATMTFHWLSWSEWGQVAVVGLLILAALIVVFIATPVGDR